MIGDAHRTEILEAIPEAKRAKKRQKTVTGIVLVSMGALSAIGSFVLTVMVLKDGGEINKVMAVFLGAPFIGGLFCAVLGAHVWSGEYVSAGLRDIGAALKVWRKNGGGS